MIPRNPSPFLDISQSPWRTRRCVCRAREEAEQDAIFAYSQLAAVLACRPRPEQPLPIYTAALKVAENNTGLLFLFLQLF